MWFSDHSRGLKISFFKDMLLKIESSNTLQIDKPRKKGNFPDYSQGLKIRFS